MRRAEAWLLVKSQALQIMALLVGLAACNTITGANDLQIGWPVEEGGQAGSSSGQGGASTSSSGTTSSSSTSSSSGTASRSGTGGVGGEGGGPPPAVGSAADGVASTTTQPR